MPEGKRRRGNGTGSVFYRADRKKWLAQVTLADGRQRSRSARTEREAHRLLRELQRQAEAGTLVQDTRLTTERYLHEWLQTIRPTVRYSTWQRYETAVRFHLNPALGKTKLHQLDARQVQRLYADLDGTLAPATIRYLHAVLRRALGQALKWGLVARNVATLAEPPRAVRTPPATLDPDAARRLLTAASHDPYEALWVLALTSGMRQGELLALRWRDLDLEAGRLTVNGTLTRDPHGHLTITETKTRQSRRTVLLTRLAVGALRRHRTRQSEARLAAGPAWAALDYVFATALGTPLSPNEVRGRYFPRLLERAGVPPMRFHDLRHSAATLLLGRSIPPKVVAEMLGHSVQMLMTTYAHLLPGAHERAAETMDDLLRGETG